VTLAQSTVDPDEVDYSLLIEDASNNVLASKSGTTSDSGKALGMGTDLVANDIRGFVAKQNRNGVSGTQVIDQLTVESVPTPGALPVALALAGGVTMIRRRRKA
jgi:MYXO-CTERM domain-containing protein